MTSEEAVRLLLAALELGRGRDILVPVVDRPTSIVDIAKKLIGQDGNIEYTGRSGRGRNHLRRLPSGIRAGVVFQKSQSLGTSWTEPLAVAETGPQRWSDKPVLAISPDGRDIYIAYNESDSYVVASHDHGRRFGKPRRTNNDSRYWFHSGGAVASNGDVYIAAADFCQSYRGNSHINVLRSTDRAKHGRPIELTLRAKCRTAFGRTDAISAFSVLQRHFPSTPPTL